MNLFQKKTSPIQENKNTIVISGETLEVRPLTFSESVDVIFLSAPYLKFIKRAKIEYNEKTDGNMYRFMVETLLGELDKEDTYKIFALLLHTSIEKIKNAETRELVLAVPVIIRVNELINLYSLFKHFGVFD